MSTTRTTPPILRFELRRISDDEYRIELRDGSADGLAHDAITITAAEVRGWRERSRYEPDLVGAALAERIFTSTILPFYRERIGSSAAGRVRVEFCIHDADNPLHSLPWELMHGPATDHSSIPLAADETTPFSRFDALQRTLAEPLPRRTLRLTVVVANPWDLGEQGMATVAVEPLLRELLDRLAAHSRSGHVQVTVLPGVTELSAELTAALHDAGWTLAAGEAGLAAIQRLSEMCDLLYLTAHGRGDLLLLEADGGAIAPVAAATISDKISGAGRKPHLIFLAACFSGERTGDDAFAALGPKLHAAGIPAVIAMQDTVAMDAARSLAADFFAAQVDPTLADGQVDLALNRARRLLYDRKTQVWAPPVLFCRLRSGRLWADAPPRPHSELLAKIAALVVLAVLLLVGGLLWRFRSTLMDWWAGPVCADHPLCAVVAQVEAPEPRQGDELTAEIAQKIRDVLDQDAPGQYVVAIAPNIIDDDAAGTLAADEGALLVVWGRILELADNKLRVHFILTDQLGVGESHDLRTLRAEPLKYDSNPIKVVCANCLDITEGEAGQRVAIVAYTAAGLLSYADQPEKAYFSFMAALYCAGEEIEPGLLAVLRPICTRRTQPADWNPALLHYYAGKSAVLSGDYETGIDLLQTAAEENLEDPAAPLSIAATYQTWIGDTAASAAVTAFAEAEKRSRDLLAQSRLDNAERAAIYHNLGLGYELQANWPRAQESYAKAVERFGASQPSAYVSLVRLGYAQRQNGDLTGAEDSFEQAAALDKTAPWAYLELASLAWNTQQDRQTAEQWLRQAEQVAPDNAYVHLRRAELCTAWEDSNCTENAYEMALARRPDSGWLHSRVGAFYLPTNPVRDGQKQDWDKAAEHYARAVELRPRDPWANERLGYVLLNQRRPVEAVDYYARAIASTYDDSAPARIYCSLAAAQQSAGLPDEAEVSRAACEQRTLAGE